MEDKVIKPNRTIAVEAVNILNDFTGDCISSVMIFLNYYLDEKLQNETRVAIHRFCMSYLILTLYKWLEFYDRYHQLIPSDLHEECKKLTKDLRSRKIEDFRNTLIGHIWNKELNRPLYKSEIDKAFQKITKGDLIGFLKWINDPKGNIYPKTFESIVETVRDRLIQEYKICYDDEILSQ